MSKVPKADIRREKEARQMDQLRDYLAYPLWSSHEARSILAGIDPEKSSEAYGDWGAWLPGGLQANGANNDRSWDRRTVERHALLQLKYLEGFIHGPSRRPRDWIAHAKSLDYEPCWLLHALEDQECRKYLPVERDAVPLATKGGRESARAKRQKHNAKLAVLDHWILWENNPKKYSDDRSFIADMEDKYFEEDINSSSLVCVFNDRTIRRWVKELASTPQPEWVDRLKAELAASGKTAVHR